MGTEHPGAITNLDTLETAVEQYVRPGGYDRPVTREAKEIWDAYDRNYVREGSVIANSRFTPTVGMPPLREGEWFNDDWRGNYGKQIEHFAVLDPRVLTPTENSYQMGRGDDVERYAEWLREGKTPPPISVIEAENGELRIINGHRRYNAARISGRKVPAMVSPAEAIPGAWESGVPGFLGGKPIKTGLTAELGQFWDAVKSGKQIPDFTKTAPELQSHIRRAGIGMPIIAMLLTSALMALKDKGNNA